MNIPTKDVYCTYGIMQKVFFWKYTVYYLPPPITVDKVKILTYFAQECEGLKRIYLQNTKFQTFCTRVQEIEYLMVTKLCASAT